MTTRTRLPGRSDVRVQITLLEGDRLEVWSRDRMPADEFARLLRTMADRFDTGDVTRVQ